MSAEPGGPFATLTHARLRVGQGDVAGAARILRVILEVQPSHDEARRLLAEIENRATALHKEPRAEPPEAVTPATAHDLSHRFRAALDVKERGVPVDRLHSWLERMRRNRGERRV